jgi:hypothetical protein
MKIQLNFKVGPKEIEEFELKDSNLRKVMSYSVQNGERTEGEGFWAYFSDEDVETYDQQHSGIGYAIAVNCNDTFNGIPYLF